MLNLFININNILNITFFGNEIYRVSIAVIAFLVLFFWIRFVFKFLDNLVKNNNTRLYLILWKVLNTIKWWFLLAFEIYIPLKILNLTLQTNLIINIVFWFLLMLQLIILFSKIITHSLLDLFKKQWDKKDKTAQKTIEMIVNIVVWIIWILIFITNIGVNLTPLVASLWVASVAVAFALQNILKDLFSSFSIIISKPFNVWDFIIVWEWSKDKMWTVKDITLKSTYLLNTWWYEIVIPNSKILDTEVINYGKMKHRRKRFTIWVTYETAIKKLEKIPKIIEDAINKVENVKYERCYLNELNAYSIDFFISYDILQPDYLTSLVVKEKIVLNILKWFEKEWISIAYPTQTIHSFVNK